MKKRPAAPNGDHHDEDGYLCLKGDLFWRWRALDAETRTAQMALERATSKIQAEIDKNPALKELLADKAAAAGAVSAAMSELRTVQADIEEKMGLSIKDCSFDDKTGRLYVHAPDGTKEPVKPAKRSRRKAT